MIEPKFFLRIYISRSYDIESMPGYITIPYNFDFETFKEFFFKNKDEALRIKQKVKFLI